MRTNLLNNLSNVLKKGTNMNLLPKMDRECIGNDSRMDRQSLGKIFRYAAMITLLLTLACGNVWGDVATFSGDNLNAAAEDKTVGSITLSTSNMTYSSGLYASGSGKTFTLTASGGATISQVVITMSGTSNRYEASNITNCTSCAKDGSVYTCTISPAASSVSCTNNGGGLTITRLDVTYSSGYRKFKSGERIYFKDDDVIGGVCMKYSGNKLWAVFDGTSSWIEAQKESGSWDSEGAIYYFDVPGSGQEYSFVIFTRNDWGIQTGNEYASTGYNMFVLNGYDGNKTVSGYWARYAPGSAILGDFNNWDPDKGKLTDGRMILELAASTAYGFKVLMGDGSVLDNWYGLNSGNITNTTSSWWTLKSKEQNCTVTSGEAGEYCFHWNSSDKQIGIYYPQARLTKNKYLYFNGNANTSWNAKDPYHAKFSYKYYDSGGEQSYLFCSNEDSPESHIYYTVVPNNDYIGRVQVMCMYTDHSAQHYYANTSYAYDRTSSKQNCLVAPSAGSDGINLTWGTYCPPMTKPTLTDNNGSTIYAGNGTSGNPYIVGVSTSISVSASASTTLDDPDMTAMYDFKAGGSSQQDTEGTTYTFTASSSDNTSYTLTVDAYNTYNSTNSTKKTSDALYYKARTLYNIQYKKGDYGTGDEVTDKKAKTIDITLRGVTFTRTGYTQTGWNANKSGGGTHYNLSASYTSNSNLTIYPEWTAKTTSVTLNPNTDNHGTGTNVVATATFDGTALSGFTAATPASGYALEGYYTGATSGDKILNANGSYVKNTTYTTNDGTPKWKSEDATLTLYAHYVPTYTVTYKKNGGASGADGDVTGTTTDANSPYVSGSEVTGLASGFTNSGYKFKWWNKNYGGDGMDVYAGEKFTISANTNLYAQWEQVASGWAFWCGDAMNATYTDISGNGVTMRLTRTNVDYNTNLTDASTEVNKQSSVQRHAKVLAIDKKNTDYLTINFTEGEAINSLKLGVCNKGGTKEMLVIYSTTADFSSGEGEKVALNTKKYDQSTKAVYDFSPSTKNKYPYARVYMQLDEAVYGQTGGSGNTIRIYSIKAQAGASCTNVGIGTQPTSVSNANVGSASTLTVVGSGTNPTYQWQTCNSDGSSASDITSGTNPSGYTTGTLSFTPSTAGTTYYKCVVSGDCGSPVTSNVVSITAKTMPTQYTVSGTASICSGDNTDITLSDSEEGVSYQLYKGGVAEGSAKAGTGDELTWSVLAAGTYTVTAVGDANYWERAMSGSATVSFKTATSISTQPATAVDATVDEDFTLGSALVAAGDGTLQYQWFSYSNAAGDADETSVRSASATKTFTTSQASAGTYYYRVKVIGGCGTVASDVIAVTVSACSPKILISATLSNCSSTGDVTGTPGGSSEVSFASCDEIDGGYKMGKDGSYMYLTLSSGKFEEGDKVSITITKANDGVGDGALHVYKYMSSEWTELGSTPASTAGTFTYTLTAANVATDFNCIGLYRESNQNPYVKSLTVTRPCSGYTISFQGNGNTDGSMSDVTEIEEGDDVTLAANGFTKNGYTFANWTADVDVTVNSETVSAGSAIANQATIQNVTSDITLTAQWTPNDYTITYHLNGASWASSAGVASYTVGTGATLPVAGDMTNTGYTFGGWYDNSGLTGSSVTAISTSDYGNKEYWAKWTENTYTITYNKNNGSATGTTDNTVGHYVTVADCGFELADHIFAGWNTETNGSGASYSAGEEIELTANMTLYAQWGDDYTITWGDVQIGGAGDAVTPNLGGGNYTITATIASWTGSTGDIELGTVTDGVTAAITGTTASTVTITFDVTAAVVGEAISLTLDIPANGSYGAKSEATEIDIDRCDGGSYVWDFSDREAATFTGQTYSFLATDGTTEMRYTAASSSEGIVAKTYNKDGSVNKLGYLKENGNSGDATVYDIDGVTPVNRTRLIRLFITGTGRLKIDCSDNIGKYKLVNGSASGSVLLADYKSDTTSAEINVTISPLWIDTKNKGYINKITWTASGGSGKITPTLTWDTDLSSGVAKETGAEDFTHTVTQDKNSLGAITYASSNTSVATVNATTGKVHIAGVGSATITATLAASGCYNQATNTYTITVTSDCDDVAGTVSSRDLGCDGVELTVTGHTTSGEKVSYQWYKDGASLGGSYTAAKCTVNVAGNYYVVVTNTGTRHCAMTSTNSIDVSARSTVSATKLVDSWYVKNGRRTPDIALVKTIDATGFTVKSGSTPIWNSDGSVSTGFAGCPFHMDSIIYLDGQTSTGAVPSGLSAGDETLTITVTGCSGEPVEYDITIHKQASTPRPSVAYVSLGTDGGAVTDTTTGYYKTAALYKYLDNTLGGGDFDLTARNAYWSVDEQELKEHYSQFDAILITDDPSTDKKKEVDGKKYSYINAIGCLVDIRPILTMEAYVAKWSNWKAKGITGTPESPNPRQYGMKLQCKQHAIFAGINAASTNVDVETIDGVDYWTVLMVDSTKSPYTGVAYNVETAGDKKPALQGFAASSVSEDLLLLGEIKDGTLFAGVERQTEPAARLLVLGINAKALPNALTDEGKMILENSLHYLLQTELERVDDCSNYFTGAVSTDWNNAANWSKGQIPNSPTIRVRILKPCEIKNGDAFKAASVDIASSGKSLHLGGGACSGKLTINAGGALIVGGKVKAAEAPRFNTVNLKQTEAKDLELNTSSTSQAALIFNNDEGKTQATVNLYSLGRKDGGTNQFQYFAIPMSYLSVNPTFANETHGITIYTYVWLEATGWERRGYYTDLYAFEGIGITTDQTTAHEYTMKGTLASTKDQEIPITADGKKLNLIGNSWTAPIQISELEASDFGDASSTVEQTVYIYCAGHGKSTADGKTEAAGQWLAIPFEATEFDAWDGLKVIPSMQAFQIKTRDEGTLTLDYDKHVRGGSTDLTAKLRAPQRRAAHDGVELMRIRVADSKTHTDLYLFEGDQFSDAFDNGWEANYRVGTNESAKLYARVATGVMSVAAMSDLEGTPIYFIPGQETEYTFTFGGNGMGYYLNDLKLQQSTLISEGAEYSFTYEKGDAAARFMISATPYESPQVTTGTENVQTEDKPRKILYNNKLYIIYNGHVYSADGAIVK